MTDINQRRAAIKASLGGHKTADEVVADWHIVAAAKRRGITIEQQIKSERALQAMADDAIRLGLRY